MSFGEVALPEDQIQERNLEVVRLTVEGKTKQFIQSQTGVPPRLQKDIMEEYRHFIRRDMWTEQRSKEIVGEMDLHFTSIIQKQYEAVDSADMADDYKAKSNILKAIADTEAKRVDALQKAGVLSAQGIGDEVARVEERQQAIIEILKEVAKKYPEAAKFISEKIAELNGQVIATRVVSDE